MGRRGPKPEPAAVKVRKGNSARRPIGKDPEAKAEASAGAIAPPSWLKDEGLKVWNRLAPRLAAMKLLTPVDAETFGRYCRNFARWLMMQERLDTMGDFYEIETASGIVRRSDPAGPTSVRLELLLERAEANFGLNPAERQRILAARAGVVGLPAGDLFGSQDGQAAAAPTKPKDEAPADAIRPATAIGFLN
jgi:phage terminase, small subunit, putative, P27 family